MTPRLAVAGAKKSFGATVALLGVDLRAAPGEVHAIVGENGAGKSTLMGILSGAIAPDAGTMSIDGTAYVPRSPRDARDRGVAIVHQELSLCAHLTVAENMMLGREPLHARLFVKRREEAEMVRAALARVLGHEGASRISPDARAGDLTPADQQLVEIARAMIGANARVLILDEPTSSLASDDAARLFALLRRLRDDGVTVLYISHFLEEIKAIADRFTVLRDGASVGDGDVASVSVGDIVEKMAGRKVGALFGTKPRATKASDAEIVLEVSALRGEVKPSHASLALRRGEVLGIAGLVGAGRTELLRAIFGLDRVRAGTVKVGTYMGPYSPARALARGVGLLSEDRKREGLALTLSIADNVTLSSMRGWVSPSKQRASAARWIKELAIRAGSPDDAVIRLSGGNQQKVAIARLLEKDVDVLLLDEPTRGIDVGSKSQIYELIHALTARGKSVLIVSSYLPELFGVCDRIAVMCRGKLGEARAVSELDERAVLREAAGA